LNHDVPNAGAKPSLILQPSTGTPFRQRRFANSTGTVIEKINEIAIRFLDSGLHDSIVQFRKPWNKNWARIVPAS
jgi:hypothetical protein